MTFNSYTNVCCPWCDAPGLSIQGEFPEGYEEGSIKFFAKGESSFSPRLYQQCNACDRFVFTKAKMRIVVMVGQATEEEAMK